MDGIDRPSDSELLERCRARDADAFSRLIDRHKNLTINYLTRLTGCRDRAEELAQETFVRFYQTLDRYRDSGTLEAYLLRIATNLVRSEERRKLRWRLLEPLYRTGLVAAGPGSSGHGSPQAQALAREEHEQVSRALAALDLTYRAPLVLREIEGLSYQQIAAALGLNEGTVKSRLHRGRRLLQRQLEPYWNGSA